MSEIGRKAEPDHVVTQPNLFDVLSSFYTGQADMILKLFFRCTGSGNHFVIYFNRFTEYFFAKDELKLQRANPNGAVSIERLL